DDFLKLVIIQLQDRVLQRRSIGRTLAVRAVADMAFRRITAITRECSVIDRPVLGDLEGRDAFGRVPTTVFHMVGGDVLAVRQDKLATLFDNLQVLLLGCRGGCCPGCGVRSRLLRIARHGGCCSCPGLSRWCLVCLRKGRSGDGAGRACDTNRHQAGGRLAGHEFPPWGCHPKMMASPQGYPWGDMFRASFSVFCTKVLTRPPGTGQLDRP